MAKKYNQKDLDFWAIAFRYVKDNGGHLLYLGMTMWSCGFDSAFADKVIEEVEMRRTLEKINNGQL